MPGLAFFADDPVDGSNEAPDRLGRMAYAKYLVTLLDEVRAQSESSVLALIGPWGGGKSSVLDMAMKEFGCRPEWQVAQFNPWTYADLEAMLLGFFSEIAAVMPEKSQSGEIRKNLGTFLDRIKPLGKVGGLFNIDAEGIIGGLSKLISGDQSATAQQQKLVKALREAEQPILVVIDDLDRLAPSEVLLVFKLVRLVGRLPFLYYLLSYDERTLLDVLARTELCGDDPARARDYLEKIVQIRLDLPPLSHEQARIMLRRGLSDLLARFNIPHDQSRMEDFYQAFDVQLLDRLTTPRTINRYLAQVGALYAILGEEVNFIDFAVLTFIRTFEPVLYAALYRRKNELAVAVAKLPAFNDSSDHLAAWRALLEACGVAAENNDGLIDLLATIFLPVAAAVRDGGYDNNQVSLLAERKSVGHPDYFDRYFTFGVPEEDLPDAWVHETLAALARLGPSEPAATTLRHRIISDTARTVRKISRFRPGDLLNDRAIITLLGEQFEYLSDKSTNGPSSRQIVKKLAEKILADHQVERFDLIATLPGSLGGTLLSTRLLANRPAPNQSIETNSAKVANVTEGYCQIAFTALPPDILNLLYIWNMADPNACRAWLHKQIEASHWDALDIAAWKLTFKVSSGERVIDSLDEKAVDALLGVEYLLNRYSSKLYLETTWKSDLKDNEADRREGVMRALSVIAKERINH